MQYNGKYPVMTAEYESANVPGLYFAGTLAHGKDHLKSAGGFIHGFRYTTRALFRILETKRHRMHVESLCRTLADAECRHALPTPPPLWPAQTTFVGVDDWIGRGVGLQANGCNAADWTGPEGGCTTPLVPAESPFESLLNTVFTRVNIASGPYQMVSILSDAMVFRCGPAGAGAGARAVTAEYFEEIPVEYFHARFDTSPRIVWHFGYEKQRQSLHDSRRLGTLFQVHFWYYPGTGGGCTALESVPIEHTFTIPVARVGPQHRVREKEILRLGEELHGSWNAYELRQRVGEWMHSKIVALRDAALATAAPVHMPQQSNADAAAAVAAAVAAAAAAAVAAAAAATAAAGVDVDVEVAAEAPTLKTCKLELPMLSRVYKAACLGKSSTGGSGGATNSDAPPTDSEGDCDNAKTAFAAMVTECDAVLKSQSHTSKKKREDAPAAATRGTYATSDTASDVGASYDARVAATPVLGAAADMRWGMPIDFEFDNCVRQQTASASTGPKTMLTANKQEKIEWECAQQKGSRWPGGLVYQNVANHCKGTVSLWQGSLLKEVPTVQPHQHLLEPGAGRRIESHERDLWQARGGGGELLLEWVVDVANGAVQDIVVKDCQPYQPESKREWPRKLRAYMN
jgi:hypothetical protein